MQIMTLEAFSAKVSAALSKGCLGGVSNYRHRFHEKYTPNKHTWFKRTQFSYDY